MTAKKLIILLAAALLSTAAFAQTDSTSTKDSKPKTPAVKNKKPEQKQETVEPQPEPVAGTLDAAWKPVVMDHYIGFRGGYGLGTARFQPMRHVKDLTGLINIGLTYKFNAPDQLYVGCIEVDLNYMEKGFMYETEMDSGIFYSRKYSVIELPILWQPYFPLSKKNNLNRIFLNAGPYLGYALNSTYKIYNDKTGDTIEEGNYGYYPARDNYFEFGIVIGGGFQIAVKNFTMALDFRYNIMLSDMLKGQEIYPGNPFRSPCDQMNISFAVGYKLFTSKGSDKTQKTN